MSWFSLLLWIIIPEHKNNNDLNIAWVIKWKNLNFGKFNDKIKIIKPNCLSVDNAIIFLKSNSKIAFIPAINIVNIEIYIINIIIFVFRILLNRIIKYTPAVTKVEEWTKDDTGVGAAIANGNHVANGTCALFVIAAIKIKKEIIKFKYLFVNKKFHELNLIINEIDIKIQISPKRFIKIVIKPEFILLIFW